jgi:HSP20 family molecular chaperone IbpA
MTKGFGPMLEVARIQSEINRLFDNLLDLDNPEKEGGTWIPLADIRETEEFLLVVVELPGVALADLSISTHGGDVILKGRSAARWWRRGRPASTSPSAPSADFAA